MPGRDGTGPLGNGSVGSGRGGSGNGRGRGGCRNSGGKNNRFVNNRFGSPYCRRWDNSNPNDVLMLKNQAAYYQKQLDVINEQISNLDVEQPINED